MVPGATLAQVKAALQAKGYGTDTDVAQTQIINTAYRRILSMWRWTFLDKATTLTTSTGVGTVTLSTTDMVRPKLLYVVDPTGSNYVPMKWLPQDEIREIGQDPARGMPAYWSRAADQLLLSPYPDRAYTLSLVYQYLPPDLVSGGDVLVIPRGHEDVVVWEAIKGMAFRQRDWGALQSAKAEFNEMLKEMVDAYGKEQDQSTRQVGRWAGWDDLGV